MKALTRFTALALAAVTAAGCSRDSAPTGPVTTIEGVVAGKAEYDPVIVPTDFVSDVTHPFFPLVKGTTYHYQLLNKDGEVEEMNDVAVTHDHKVILGVTVTVVHDQVFVDGKVREDTFDWYAQHRDGTVWYFGEDTRTLDENGNLVTTFGSWTAGEGGAKPGIIMLADPKVGMTYRQEYLPGVVEDMGKVLSLKAEVAVPYGTFTHCLETADWTPLEPGHRAHKFYARGVGTVLEESTKGGGERLELLSITR